MFVLKPGTELHLPENTSYIVHIAQMIIKTPAKTNSVKDIKHHKQFRNKK